MNCSTARASAANVEKIVLNLVSNAFKFTFEEGIAVQLRHATSAAELKVRDTGTGIPEHELPACSKQIAAYFRTGSSELRPLRSSVTSACTQLFLGAPSRLFD